MENRLVVQQQGVMSVNDVSTMAEMFAKSGLFEDTKQMAQAFVKIQAGQEIGIAPFLAMTGIHIIKGKPTIGAGIMASKIKGSGKYDYTVVQQDDKACSIDFFEGKKKLGNSTFTIQDATKAGTQNLAKFPKNMLFARAISNGLKWYCPDVFDGPVYTPEEMNTVTEDIPHTVVEEPPYEQDLREQGSLEDLKDYFTKMPKAKQVEFKDLAAELKAAFEAELTPAALPGIDDDAFTAFIGDLALSTKANATAILKAARTEYSFTADQEAEINKTIAGLTSRKAA